MIPTSSLIFQTILIAIFALKIIFVASQMPIPKNPILSSAIAYLHFYLDYVILLFTGMVILTNIYFPYYFDPMVFSITLVIFLSIVLVYFKFFVYDHLLKSPKITIIGMPERIEDKLFKTINDYFYLKGHNIKEFSMDEFTYFKLDTHSTHKTPFLCVKKKREKNSIYCSYEISFEEEPGIITNDDFNNLIKNIYTQVDQTTRFLLIVLFFIISVLIIYWFGIYSNRWDQAILIYSFTQQFIFGKIFIHYRTFKHNNFDLFYVRYQTYLAQKK